MALSGLWSRLTGGIFGVGVGIAAADAMEPIIEPAKQEAWLQNTNKVLALGELANLAAQAIIDIAQAEGEAARTGFDANRMQAVAQGQLTAPNVGELLQLLRRGFANPGNVTHGFRKHKLEPMWDALLLQLQDVILSPQDLAVMLQRTVVANNGILPNQPDTSGSNVPPMPQISIDPIVEAAMSGLDAERFAGLARIIGLPASPDLAARMTFRNIITPGAFNQAILEGNTRGEWAPFLLEGFREIVSARDGVQSHLRGWSTAAEMYAQTARHGMSQADTDLLYQISRRPLTPRAITTALARGGQFFPQPGGLTDPYDAAVHQQNLGPEWYDLAKANKYAYTVPFWWRSMATSNAFGTLDPHQILLDLGNEPTFAAAVVAHFVGTGTAASDPHVTKAENQLWATLHASYKAEEIDAPTATATLGTLGVAGTAVPQVLSLWDAERALIRAQLTPAQIKKAVFGAVTNPATGQPWTQAEALAQLLARGYSQADATTFLNE